MLCGYGIKCIYSPEYVVFYYRITWKLNSVCLMLCVAEIVSSEEVLNFKNTPVSRIVAIIMSPSRRS